jgi:polysaccharide biosynthesis protein PelE
MLIRNHLPYDSIASYFQPADVHEVEKIQGAESVVALILSILWTFLHGINAYFVFMNGMPFLYGVIIHVVLTLVIAVVTYMMKSMGVNIRHLYVLSVASGGAGVFGAAGALLSSLLTVLYNSFSQPFSEWYHTIFPKIDLSHEEVLHELITSGKDESARMYQVVSFYDVIALGTESQKRRALSRMTDHFNPSFAPAYKRALKDSSNAVRVQAASSIGKIENQFSSLLMKIEQLEKKYPKDSVIKLGLARFYDSYAFTGLLDKDREDENRIKALTKYKEYLEMKPEDIDARIEAGRLLLRSGEHGQVITLFNDCIDAGYGNDTLKLLMLEAYYQAGRYGDLRRAAPACLPLVKELHDVRPRLARSVEFWGGAVT